MSVYQINCKCGLKYVGSTGREYRLRLNEHHSECFNPNRAAFNAPTYTHFRECEMTKDDIIMIKIEDVENPLNLLERESHWINEYGTLNTYDTKMCPVKKAARLAKRAAINKIPRMCECGSIWTGGHRARHLRTIKHNDYIKNLIVVESDEL